ncbi:hypothetical protein BZM27_33340 [Paraburkholderia steynii]|uniref:Uncharacterized protein n=1 Tax=Paraburkholderia steynii TaxID=1245441 RepID=A0A4R0X6A6_9BURK|nr:hypothetical protein BZM27_33340 [Paraburkholderia steynii]
MSASGTGLVINYEFSAQTNSPTQYGLYSEERFFYPGGLLDNTGTAYWYRNLHRYVRLDTTWSHSNPDTMVTTRVGDTISSSLTWTRPVRLGGAQVSRDFTLRPDLITYPVPTLAGSSAVPSAVDLYVNNVRQFTGSAPSGPFVINAVPAINGAGEARDRHARRARPQRNDDGAALHRFTAARARPHRLLGRSGFHAPLVCAQFVRLCGRSFVIRIIPTWLDVTHHAGNTRRSDTRRLQRGRRRAARAAAPAC